MNKKCLLEYLEKVPDDAEICMEIVCGKDCSGISIGWVEYVSGVQERYDGREYVILKEAIG